MNSFKTISLLGDPNKVKIRLDGVEWNVLIVDKSILFSAITRVLLNIENLFFYASSRESTYSLEETREYIQKRIKTQGYIFDDVASILHFLGWLPSSDIDASSTVFQGDIGELLMCELIDQLNISHTLIAKISLKTGPYNSIHGNDNSFYDYEKNILYFGEAKFYSNMNEGLADALDSLYDHSKNDYELDFIFNKTSSFLADNGEIRSEIVEKFESRSKEEFELGFIMFVMFDNVYEKREIEDKLRMFIKSHESQINAISNMHIVLLPVLDKDELLNFIIDYLEEHYEQ